MNAPQGPSSLPSSPQRQTGRVAQILIVSSVMFTFISYWRTAAVVLCDLASTSFYIGGIVELSVGKAAPWFILAVMVFSYAVRWVYIESCTLFIRGGVYRVVREALGRFPAKIAVSALMFDYILTGPISGVSAGQYIVGLILALMEYATGTPMDPISADFVKRWGAVGIACGITVYFYRLNIRGLHESSEKALKIMIITTLMGVIVLGWCGVTVALRGAEIPPTEPRLIPRINPDTNTMVDPLGFISATPVGEGIRTVGMPTGSSWLSMIGLMGLFVAFGHSILAMSGEETLAQVYREVESPKLQNFKKAAFVVFAFSLLLTATISFLAVMIIPDEIRMEKYSSNLIGGLAMNVIGPEPARLALNAFVVVVGFLILSGAVNTSMIGSNGVLNRVAEDGVVPEWFLKPHSRYGTTSRLLTVIVILQLGTILFSAGDVLLLGEAYAFGVVWSFVFQALSMVVLRFKDRRPREYKVPFNITVRGVEIPVGLMIILLILLISAIGNLLTKEVATIGGIIFTGVFFTVFWFSERYSPRNRQVTHQEHLEQFNQQPTAQVTAQGLGLDRQYRKLVAIRSTQNLSMLEKALTEADPLTTGIVVMTAKISPLGEAPPELVELDDYDRELLTAVVSRAELAGKQVHPLVVPTNNPLHAVMKTAQDLQAQEVVMGASNKYTADEQIEQIAFYWINLHGGQPAPLTVRVLSRDRDMTFDIGGGNRIPKISERQARNVAELRAAGVGVDRVLMLHDGTPASSDLFQTVLTMLDPQVALGLVTVITPGNDSSDSLSTIRADEQRARQLGRDLRCVPAQEDGVEEVVRLAKDERYGLIIVALSAEMATDADQPLDARARRLLLKAHCPVFLASTPAIPHEVVDKC